MSAECSAVDIPPGYKQTEVGVIPEDWYPVTIGDIAIKVGSGITPRGGSSNYKEYGRPFVRSQNVGWGILLLADLVYIDEDTHKSFSSTELRQDDVLLNITGASIGRCAIADARLAGGNVNQHVCIIRTDSTEVDSHFLNLILLSALGRQQIDSFQAGGNREGLNFGQIRSIKFPLPPTKVEQEVIAEALSDTDALIESLEQLISKKHQIKQGAMQELLTGKKRLPGFEIKRGYKHTEVGVLPEDWSFKKLDEISIISRLAGAEYTSLWKEIPDGEIIALRGFNIGKGRLIEKDLAHISNELSLKLKRSRLCKWDVVYPCVGSIGNAVVITEDSKYHIQQNIARITPNNSAISSTYLANYLMSFLGEMEVARFNASSSQPNVLVGSLRQYRIPLPPTLAEQNAIAAILSDMDSEINALEEKLTKARQIKQGMMQELLTGRIRLL